MKSILSFLLLFIALNVFSQKEANFWYFGENAGLDFSTEPPTAIKGSIFTDEGSASISNAKGELQFYTDGQTVYDKNGSIMLNGTGLLGNSSSTQSAIIVPKPLDSNIYYIFTVTNSSNNDGVKYSTVDITKNGNLGEVTSKNTPLREAINATEKITAIKGQNCNTFWILTSDATNFYSYLIDASGVKSSAITSTHSFTSDPRGSLKFSPDGNSLVNASQGIQETFIYDFAPLTGKVTNEKRLNIKNLNAYGIGFSRSSKKLYISTGNNSQRNSRTGTRTLPNDARIIQYDLTSKLIADINNSYKEVYRTDSGYRGALQLASNGKIYYTRSRTNYLGVINFPEKEAENVSFEDEGIFLESRIATEGLPPFIQSFFLDIEIKDEDTSQSLNFVDLETCIGESKAVVPASIRGKNLKYTWTFDNGITKSEITTSAPEHKLILNNLQQSNSGTYRLVITLEDTCLNTIEYNATFNLVVNPLPIVKSIETYNQCDFDSNTTDGITAFNLKSLENKLTDNLLNEDISFYEAEDTTLSNEIIEKIGYRNPISKPFNHNLLVKITNKKTGCFSTGKVNLEVTPTSLSKYDDMYESELDFNRSTTNARNSIGTNNAIFDFDSKINKIIAENSTFNKSDFQFSFFLNKNDAEKEINQIEKPYDENKFIDGIKIYVRISKGNLCAGIGEFDLYVNKRPIPQGNINNIYLCVNNPIDSPQLITTDLDASTGNLSDTYKWYLNGNLLIGETNSILKANKEGEYRVEASRYYANDTSDLTDDFSCIGYNTFTVIESNVALIESVTFLDDQDEPSDNSITVTVTGKGNYEYSLNDNTLSNFVKGPDNLSYTFTNVPPGINKVYINDSNNCGITNTKEVSFIYFQRHFTPNGDGVYDTWKVLGIENTFYKEVQLQIFDRYGKILKNLDLKTNNGWNGNYNGKTVPSNDYWYNAVLIDINDNVRKKTGHFSLIRK